MKKQPQQIRSRNNYAKYVLDITVLSKIYIIQCEMRSRTFQKFLYYHSKVRLGLVKLGQVRLG